jgi:hypothetical protein
VSDRRRVGGRHVRAINDTTDLHFPNHDASKQGFGRDANDTCPGRFLHAVLALDAGHGGVIGLVHCGVLNRTAGKVTDHKKRPADDKESRRWLRGAERLGAAENHYYGGRSREQHLRPVRPPASAGAFALPLGAPACHDNWRPTRGHESKLS